MTTNAIRNAKIIARTAVLVAVTGCAALSIAQPAWAAPYVQDPPPINCDEHPDQGFCPFLRGGGLNEALGIQPVPHDAVSMTLKRSGLSVRAVFINSNNVSGQCHYDAQDVNGLLPGVTDDFAITGHDTVNRTYLAPPPLTTYHATVSCHGDFQGQDVEFGNTAQDVSG